MGGPFTLAQLNADFLTGHKNIHVYYIIYKGFRDIGKKRYFGDCFGRHFDNGGPNPMVFGTKL